MGVTGWKNNVHVPDGGLDTCIPNLDGDDRVELSDGSLEGDEKSVFVREHAEEAILDTHGDACGQGLLWGHKPVFLLCGLIYRQ